MKQKGKEDNEHVGELPLDVETQSISLENGARVLCIHTLSSLTHIEVIVRAGSDQESEGSYELFHFLEHLNGAMTSRKYPHQQQVIDLLSRLGANSNAYTDTLSCGYWVHGEASFAPIFLDVLLSSYLDFQIDPAIFAQEKGAVQQELRYTLDDPWYNMDYAVGRLLYGPGHRRAVHVSRRIDSVAQYTPQYILEFRRRFYTPQNTIFILAGKLENVQPLCQSVVRALNQWKSLSNTNSKTHSETHSFGHTQNSATRHEFCDARRMCPSRQAASSLGGLSECPRIIRVTPVSLRWPRVNMVRVPEYLHQDRISLVFLLSPLKAFDPRRYALYAVADILASGHFSSRLMRRLRTQMGAVYNVSYAMDLDPLEASYSSLEIVTNMRGGIRLWQRVLKAMVEEIQQLRASGVTPLEYTQYRVDTQTSFAAKATAQNPARFAGDYTPSFVWCDQVLSNSTRAKEMLRLDKSTMNQAAQEFLDLKRAFVVVGASDSSVSSRKKDIA